MDALELLPLLVAVALIALLFGTFLSARIDRMLSRAALFAFGTYIREAGRGPSSVGRRSRRVNLLRGAHMSATYRVYAARTYLFAGIAAVAGSILGIYLVAAVFFVLGIPASALRSILPAQLDFLATWLVAPRLATIELFGLFVLSNLVIGALTGLTVYYARWWWPASKAAERRRRIDESMERTVAFVFALSRSGMSLPEVMRILADNKAVYGEAAAEIEIAIRDMDLFGADIIDALRRLGERTPSENFKEFSENFVSVLQGGRSVSTFLRGQYEYYREEAEARQNQVLELLATLSEAYVTLLVAGPLFLITILVIVGLVGQTSTISILQAIIYAIVPLMTAGFVIYLDSLAIDPALHANYEHENEDVWHVSDIRHAEDGSRLAQDGGTVSARNVARLRIHNRIEWIWRRLADPIGTALRRPTSVLYVTVPLAAVYVTIAVAVLYGLSGVAFSVLGVEILARYTNAVVLFGHFAFYVDDQPLVLLDDVLVQSALFVLATFAVVYEIRRHQIREIETAVPDFLDRLASVNEAGMPIVESVGRVRQSDLGRFNVELERTWADVQWGAHLENALYRMDRRLRTPMVTRAVALITNAMGASGDLGPILRIAADEAQASRRLARERRQEVFTYVVVIYLSFVVFLTIIVALNTIFLPSIPTLDSLGSNLGGFLGGAEGLKEATKARYELLFFHAGLVQAVCSGLVAGQMGENTLKGGAKHAAAMLAAAYVVFLLLG